MKITTILDKRLKVLVQDPSLKSVKGFDKLQTRRVVDMISAIRAMTHPMQLTTVIAWKAHELTPRFPGKWSMTVYANYRLTFYVDQAKQEISRLNFEDYH